MSETLENLLNEDRQFAPPPEFAANANVTEDAYRQAAEDRLGFWAAQARRLTWAKEWDEVLDWSNQPFAKWFPGGELNVAYNCLDRHIEAGRGSKIAIHWEGEGCTISRAAASYVTEIVEGMSAEEIEALSFEDLIEQLGRELVMTRPTCATLALGTLKKGVHEYHMKQKAAQ